MNWKTSKSFVQEFRLSSFGSFCSVATNGSCVIVAVIICVVFGFVDIAVRTCAVCLWVVDAVVSVPVWVVGTFVALPVVGCVVSNCVVPVDRRSEVADDSKSRVVSGIVKESKSKNKDAQWIIQMSWWHLILKINNNKDHNSSKWNVPFGISISLSPELSPVFLKMKISGLRMWYISLEYEVLVMACRLSRVRGRGVECNVELQLLSHSSFFSLNRHTKALQWM